MSDVSYTQEQTSQRENKEPKKKKSDFEKLHQINAGVLPSLKPRSLGGLSHRSTIVIFIINYF